MEALEISGAVVDKVVDLTFIRGLCTVTKSKELVDDDLVQRVRNKMCFVLKGHCALTMSCPSTKTKQSWKGDGHSQVA